MTVSVIPTTGRTLRRSGLARLDFRMRGVRVGVLRAARRGEHGYVSKNRLGGLAEAPW